MRTASRGAGACDQLSDCLTLGCTAHVAALIVRERDAARGERRAERRRHMAAILDGGAGHVEQPSAQPRSCTARWLYSDPEGGSGHHYEADVWLLSAQDQRTLASIRGVTAYPARL